MASEPATQNSLKDSILSKIKHGDVKMHSRGYFAAQLAAIVTVVSLVLLLTILATSFLVFTLRSSGRLFLPGFGWSGIGIFLTTFPWLILFAVLVFAVATELLIKRFSYRRPFVYSFLGLLAGAAVFGTLIALTSVHPYISRQAREHQFPVAGDLYRRYEHEPRADFHHGIIKKMEAGQFVIHTDEGECIVIPNPKQQTANLDVGDEVFVMGPENDRIIRASDIRNVSDDSWFQKVFPFDLK